MAPTVFVEEMAASGREDEPYTGPPSVAFSYIDCLLQGRCFREWKKDLKLNFSEKGPKYIGPQYRRFLSSGLYHSSGVGLRALHSRRHSHRTLKLHKSRRARCSAWRQTLPMGLMATEAVRDHDARVTVGSTDSSGSSSSANMTAIVDSCSSPLRACDKTAAWVKDSVSEQERCRQRLLLLRKREGLLDITIRTVALMRRNERLQLQLSALQEETRAFVRSVLDNPENQRPPDQSDESEEDVAMQDPSVSESSDSMAEK